MYHYYINKIELQGIVTSVQEKDKGVEFLLVVNRKFLDEADRIAVTADYIRCYACNELRDKVKVSEVLHFEGFLETRTFMNVDFSRTKTYRVVVTDILEEEK